MFNVTVLKMRDIFKVIIGITFLVVVVLGISKIFHKDTKENSKGVQKIENGIISLGKEEISKIIEEDGKLEAECHFCHKKYNFSLEELKEIERGAK